MAVAGVPRQTGIPLPSSDRRAGVAAGGIGAESEVEAELETE